MRFIFTLLFFSSVGFANFTFIPPKGWDCVQDRDQLPKKVQVVYIGTGNANFMPSLNLAEEPVTISLREYVSAAKTYHEAEPETACRELGTIKTKAGNAHVLQIDRKTGWGDVRFIQATLIVNNIAYVITGTCLRDEFGTFCPAFFEAIQTFDVER